MRTESVKRLAEELLRKYPQGFGRNFEANKSVLNSLGLEMSKKMRNRVVGYITQLRQVEEQVSQENMGGTPTPPTS
ncbi:MAG: 30S ribosomal protein S17e [Candidatus Bathyarchaeia archaeon]